VEDLTYGIKALSVFKPVRDNRVCILTEAGGAGIVTTDAISQSSSLRLAPMRDETRLALEAALPPMAMVCKPNGYVDMTAAVSPAQQADALRLVLADPNVDMCILIGLPPIFRNALEVAQAVVPVAKEFAKPVAVCFMRGAPMEEARKYFEENGVATFDTPERAVSALESLARASLRKPQVLPEASPNGGHPLLSAARANGRNLLEPEALALLGDSGVPVLPSRLVHSREEAAAVVREWGCPIVLKVVSPQVIHKSDVGGVRVNLRAPEAAAEAYDAIVESVKAHVPEAELRGVLALPMAEEGVEVIVGVVQDPQFGPTVMFGLGGTLVEVFKDVSFRVAPFDRATALEMIRETRVWTLLQGVRGEKPKDVEALADLLVRVAELAVTYPEIREIDLNPVRAYERGVKVLDARVMLNN
jgi:acyl-CoA synthetase (NDP forming)